MDIKVLASSSKGNCYIVSDGHSSLLLECGIPFKQVQKGVGYNLSSIAACLLSHEHKDHSHAYKDILSRGIPLHASQGTLDGLGLASNAPFVHSHTAQSRFDVGTFSVLPFDLQHDCNEPFGYLLTSKETMKRLVFITDTYYCRYKFSSLTHIMIECNYISELLGPETPTLNKRVMRSHMSLETCLDFLKANDLSRVQEIVLLHLSDDRSDEETILERVRRATGKLVRAAEQ